jgi:hypothetical protein
MGSLVHRIEAAFFSLVKFHENKNKKIENKKLMWVWKVFNCKKKGGGKKLPNFYRKECVAKDVEGWLNFLLSIWFIAIFEDDCHFFYIFQLTITILATNITSLKNTGYKILEIPQGLYKVWIWIGEHRFFFQFCDIEKFANFPNN